MDSIFTPLRPMIEGGVPQEDIDIFVGIITSWLNQRMNLKTDTSLNEIIQEALDDMVYRDKPKKKHLRRMSKDMGSLAGFPIEEFKNTPPPTNESDKIGTPKLPL